MIRGWLQGRDLCPSGGLREAQARLGPAEREGRLRESQKSRGRPTDRQEQGPGDRDRGRSRRRDGCALAGGRGRDRGAGGAPGRARSQLQRLPWASGPRGRCSRGGTRPFLVRSPCPCAPTPPSGERGPATLRGPRGIPARPQVPSVLRFPSAGGQWLPPEPLPCPGILNPLQGAGGVGGRRRHSQELGEKLLVLSYLPLKVE